MSNNHSNLIFKLKVHSRYFKLMEYLNNHKDVNAVFIWIPKNAGTSFSNSINASKYNTEFLAHYYCPSKGIITFGHMDYNLLLQKRYISKKYNKTAFKFAFSRNPFDRMVSLFSYSKLIKKIPEHFTFTDFCREIDKGIPPIGLYNSQGLSQCNPQVRWVENINMDFIGKFENFDNDSNMILEKLLLQKKTEVSHLNKSVRKSTMEYFNKETTDIVKQIYREDFEYFNYSTSIK